VTLTGTPAFVDASEEVVIGLLPFVHVPLNIEVLLLLANLTDAVEGWVLSNTDFDAVVTVPLSIVESPCCDWTGDAPQCRRIKGRKSRKLCMHWYSMLSKVYG
jgi:hypothetical protein